MAIVHCVQLSLAEWADMFRPFSRPLLCLCASTACFGRCRRGLIPWWLPKRIDVPGASLQEVRAQLLPGTDPDTVRVSLHAGKADIPTLGWRRVGLTLDGSLRRDAQMRWLFDGTVATHGGSWRGVWQRLAQSGGLMRPPIRSRSMLARATPSRCGASVGSTHPRSDQSAKSPRWLASRTAGNGLGGAHNGRKTGRLTSRWTCATKAFCRPGISPSPISSTPRRRVTWWGRA